MASLTGLSVGLSVLLKFTCCFNLIVQDCQDNSLDFWCMQNTLAYRSHVACEKTIEMNVNVHFRLWQKKRDGILVLSFGEKNPWREYQTIA